MRVLRRAKNKWYTLYAKTAEEKQSWMQAFERERNLQEPKGQHTFSARVRVPISPLVTQKRGGGKGTRREQRELLLRQT